jgi:group I intron endonuclease
MSNCGIYRILNTRNGKFYIGSSSRLNFRKSQHFNALKNNTHSSPYLQNAYNKEQDKSVFKFQICVYCEFETLIKIEQSFIQIFNPEYNIKKVAEGGFIHSQETRDKIRIKNTGKIRTEETCKLLSEIAKKRPPISDKTKQLLSSLKKGKPANNKGKKMGAQSIEHRNKVRLSKQGEKCYNAKLTTNDVLYIRNCSETNSKLAKKFNVTSGTISDIRRNITWKHLL